MRVFTGNPSTQLVLRTQNILTALEGDFAEEQPLRSRHEFDPHEPSTSRLQVDRECGDAGSDGTDELRLLLGSLILLSIVREPSPYN